MNNDFEVDSSNNNGPKTAILGIAFVLIIFGIVGILVFLKPFDKKEGVDVTSQVASNRIYVTLNTDGGNNLGKIEVEEGQPTALPVPTKEGYLFEGWYLEDETKIVGSYKFTKETTLHAKWTEITSDTKIITITFDSKGGTSVNGITLACENNQAEIIGFPVNPGKTNYTFGGWKNANDEIVTIGTKIACSNTTLYAHWIEAKTKGNESGGNNNTNTTTTTTTTASAVERNVENCRGSDGQLQANCVTVTDPEGHETTTTKKTDIQTTPTGTGGCASGTYEYNGKCINLKVTNAGTKVCPNVTLDGKLEEGTFRNFGAGFCGYSPILKNIATTQKECEHFKTQEYGTYHWRAEERGGSCYKYTNSDYSLTCPSGYIYLTPAEVNKLNGSRSMDKLCYKYANK